MIVVFYYFLITLWKTGFYFFKTLFKWLKDKWGVKHHEGNFFPIFVSILAVYYAHCSLKIISFCKKFTIKCHVFGQSITKPCWWIKQMTISAKDILAIPVRSHTIQFLTHHPTCRILVRLFNSLSQHKRNKITNVSLSMFIFDRLRFRYLFLFWGFNFTNIFGYLCFCFLFSLFYFFYHFDQIFL